MRRRVLSREVFLNFPYDDSYLPLLQAMVFAVMDCGFWPCCALEYQGANLGRLRKIIRMIQRCPRSIHDLTPAMTKSGATRQNMALELGMSLACAVNGKDEDMDRPILIMAKVRTGLDEVLSDIRGLDVEEHRGAQAKLIRVVREWFAHTSPGMPIPAAAEIVARFTDFSSELPEIMRRLKYDPAEPLGLEGFNNYREFVRAWLENNDRSTS